MDGNISILFKHQSLEFIKVINFTYSGSIIHILIIEIYRHKHKVTEWTKLLYYKTY